MEIEALKSSSEWSDIMFLECCMFGLLTLGFDRHIASKQASLSSCYICLLYHAQNSWWWVLLDVVLSPGRCSRSHVTMVTMVSEIMTRSMCFIRLLQLPFVAKWSFGIESWLNPCVTFISLQLLPLSLQWIRNGWLNPDDVSIKLLPLWRGCNSSNDFGIHNSTHMMFPSNCRLCGCNGCNGRNGFGIHDLTLVFHQLFAVVVIVVAIVATESRLMT